MCLTETDGGVLIPVKVQPRAGRDRVVGVIAGKLKVEVSAPPVKNKANRELIKLLSKHFKIPAGSIVIRRGENKRCKLVRIGGVSAAEIKGKLDGQVKS